jgi:hypothetical protein
VAKNRDEALPKILEALKTSAPRSAAAKAAGISSRTLSRWMEDDPAIKEKVENAEAQATVELYQTLHFMASTQNFAAISKLIDMLNKNDDTIDRVCDLLEKALPAEWYALALKAIEESDL